MTLLLTILATLPLDTAVREHFDQIEVQSFFTWHPAEQPNGDIEYELKPNFVQVIFRRFDWRTATHVIEAWRMLKPGMEPQYVAAKGLYEMRWMDGQTERIITTRSLVESSSDVDSELIERALWPKEWRRDLARPRLGGR